VIVAWTFNAGAKIVRSEIHTRRRSMDGSRGELLEQLAAMFGTVLERLREKERENGELSLSYQRLEAGRACGEVPFCPACGSSQLTCAKCGHRPR
jgi:hypothetical protein